MRIIRQALREMRSTGIPRGLPAEYDGECNGVVGRIAEEIERIGTQADRAGDHTRDATIPVSARARPASAIWLFGRQAARDAGAAQFPQRVLDNPHR